MSKCKIRNGKRVCSYRKSYNPFKMWGSWIGAVIGLSYTLFLHKTSWSSGDNFYNVIKSMYFNCVGTQCSESGMAFPAIMVYLLASIIGGFFIGWVINSLWRKFR